MQAKALTPGCVKAVFSHLDCLVNAIDEVQKSGHEDYAVTSPLPRHDIEDVIYKGKPSPVRWFTAFGAVFGGTTGFTLASITHLNWPMIIPAGKPLVSIAPFIVITFEATILWGSFFTLAGMLINCGLPAFGLQKELEDDRYSDDVFGLVLNNVSNEDADKIQATLKELGAIEVSHTEAAE